MTTPLHRTRRALPARAFAITLALLLGVVSSACDHPPAPEAALARAHDLLAEHRPDAAAEVLKAALDAGAMNGDLCLQLAGLQMRRGDADAAIGTLEAGVEQLPEDLDLATQLGVYLVENGQFARADALLTPVLEHRPDAQARFYRGWAREQLDRPTGALDDYRAAVELDPGWYSPHYRLARLLEAGGQTDAAAVHRSEFDRLRRIENEIESLEGELTTTRGDPALWVRLAQAYARQGRMQQAADALASALAHNPASADLNEYSGDLLLSLGRDAEARTAYERALRLDDRRALTWLKLGDLDYAHREMASAATSYRRALAVAPDFWPAMNNLAWLLLDQEQPGDEAITLATRAAEIHPADITLDTLAMAHLAHGHLQLSREIIDRVIEMSPDDPEFQAHRDMIHERATGP